MFDASDSALDFAYPERQALRIAIRRDDESPSLDLTIETLDDVGLRSIPSSVRSLLMPPREGTRTRPDVRCPFRSLS